MTRDGSSRAARYREWRVNRVVLIVIPAVAWFPLVAAWWANLAVLDPGRAEAFLAGSLVVEGPVFNWAVAAAAVTGLVLYAHDRGRGQLSVVLEGPLRRRDVFGTKWLLGGAAVVGAIAVMALLWTVTLVVSGAGGLAGVVLLRFLVALAMSLAAFGTALAVSTVLGRLWLTTMAVATWAALPYFVVGILARAWMVAPSPYDVLIPGWIAHASTWLYDMTVFPQVTPSGPSAWWAVLGWGAWAGLMALLGFRWWETVPHELIDMPFGRPGLRTAYHGWWCFMAAMILSFVPLRQAAPYGPQVLGAFVISVAGWLSWEGVIRARRRGKDLRRRPNAAGHTGGPTPEPP